MLKLGVLLMMTTWTLATVAGCGGSKGDDCQRFWDKTAPLMGKIAPGRPMPADAKTKFLDECRQGDRMKKDPVFKCVLDASGESAVSDCMTKAFGDYASKSKQTEATLQLNKLGKNLKVAYITNATFPVGKAGPTPAEPCCKGEGAKCPVSTDWDTNEIWKALEFAIDDPTRFQYAYESDGKTATATAVGDLDCDGTMITYKLDVRVEADMPVVTITPPEPGAD